MRVREVVALDYLGTGINEPGEYLIVAVDRDGLLHQRGGNDAVLADTLIALLRDAKQLEEQL